jgi:hypothetical protein
MTDRCFSSPSSMARKALPTLFIGDTAWRGRPPPSAEFYADVFTDNMRRIIIKMKSLPSETSASPDIASACSMCPETPVPAAWPAAMQSSYSQAVAVSRR